VKKGAHLKNFVSMVAIDTMAIGGSDIAKDLLRVRRSLPVRWPCRSRVFPLQQMEEMSEYKEYKTITLRDDPAANCLSINGTVLHLPADHRYGESIRVNLSTNTFDDATSRPAVR
jgi:hypothetical protein